MPTYTGNTPVAPPLYLYYTFDELSGTTCADSSGNSRNGTVSSATFTAGKFNNCISLGTAGVVTPSTITWSQPITVSFWYRGTGGSATTRGLVTNTSNQVTVYANGSNKFSFSPAGTSGPETVSSTTSISLSTWYHVVCTISSGNNTKIYINGTLEDQKTGLTLSAKTSNVIGFGGVFPPNGDIDDFRVYSAVLTDAQISDLFVGINPTGNLIPTHPTISGAATMALPPKTATATLSRSHPTLASTAHFVRPVYTGAATLARSHPIVAGTAVSALPVYTGSSNVVRNHPLVAGAAIKVPDGTLSCWISGSDEVNWVSNLPLLIIGAGGVDNSLDLILPKVASQPVTGSNDLFLQASSTFDSNLGLNLVVKAGTWIGINNRLPCSITGGDQDGAYTSLPLVITGTTPTHSSILNLVVLGPDQAEAESPLNLYIRGGGTFVGSSLPLYLLNTPPTTAQLKLFIAGPPGTPGAIPAETMMNLWIEWGAQGVLPLVINPGVVSDSTLLYVVGLAHLEASTTLFITGEGGVIYNSLDLAIPNVYEPTALNNSLDISMPKTIGFAEGVCTTHINGWGS